MVSLTVKHVLVESIALAVNLRILPTGENVLNSAQRELIMHLTLKNARKEVTIPNDSNSLNAFVFDLVSNPPVQIM